jgi:hypothetical protein
VHSTFPFLHPGETNEIAAYFEKLLEHAHLLSISMDYLEVATAIPFVTWTTPENSCTGPFVYAPQLYLNQPFATFLGWLVGYAKDIAWMFGDMTNIHVIGLDFSDRFEGEAAPMGTARPPSDFPNFEKIRPMLTLPVIGQILHGPFVRTQFIMELDQAKLRPARAKVRLTDRYFKPMQPEITHASDGIDTAELGAFCMEVPWVGKDPVVCHSSPTIRQG